MSERSSTLCSRKICVVTQIILIQNLFAMQIKRDLCLERLIHAIGNQMIKVVTGMRRCGKSYLLFTIFHNDLLESGVDESHIIEVDLE